VADPDCPVYVPFVPPEMVAVTDSEVMAVMVRVPLAVAAPPVRPETMILSPTKNGCAAPKVNTAVLVPEISALRIVPVFPVLTVNTADRVPVPLTVTAEIETLSKLQR
jgi:hypothetical protein